MFTKKRSYALLVVMVMVFTVFTAYSYALSNTPGIKNNLLGINSIDKMKPNGLFEIQVLKGDKWQDAESLAFDRFFRERAIDLSPYVAGQKTVRIRLTPKGGGAAHIDSVFLEGKAAKEIRLVGSGSTTTVGQPETVDLQKISHRDYDVIDASGETLELTFQIHGAEKTAALKGHDTELRLVARMEGATIGKIPFQFPRENLYRPMDLQSKFYGYRFNAEKGSLKIDGDLDEVLSSKPFFKEYSRTGSGHPSGFTYGWVRNDDEHLYVAMDFTPDNTMDGDKDYAKLYAKTKDGLKEFKVSVPETKWGSPGFTYTDKVAYQHKVYEFKIPLKELGVAGNGAQEMQLAFAAYGTAGPGDSYPQLAYDPANNRYLLVYTNVDIDRTYCHLLGQLLTANGTAFSDPFPICNHTESYPWSYSVAYDSISQRFLIAWRDNRGGIYGQLVNADGSLYGTASDVNFVISNAGGYQYGTSVAYDSVNQRFMVVWQDNRSGIDYDIYGQLVNADGSLYGTTSDVNFVISNGGNFQGGPAVAYDSVNQRFMVVWQDYRNATSDIYGQMVNADGSLFDTASNVNFVISNGPDGQYETSLAYDSANQRFLVAWEDYRSGINYDIYGQLVNADGSLSNGNLVISNGPNSQEYPSVVYDNANQRFLVAWVDGRNGNPDFYGQLVNANGTTFKTDSDVNFTIYEGPPDSSGFTLASNSGCRNFLVSYDFYDAGIADIGTVLVGYPCVTALKVLSPNGGDVLMPASSHLIEWAAPANAETFKIKYSLDKGLTWKSINCSECHGGSPGPITTTDHEWFVPLMTSNKKNCLVKVIGYNAKNVQVSADKSDATFSIEVMKVTYPNGGEPLFSGDPMDINWTVNQTKREVAKMIVSYTTNGGTTWRRITALTAGPYLPGNYTQSIDVPSVPAGTSKAKCKVRVVLEDAAGSTLGSDTSDRYFSITSP